jgi:WD40 repeat protein
MAETKKPEAKQPEKKPDPKAPAKPAEVKKPEAQKKAEPPKKPEAKKPAAKKPTETFVVTTLNDKASLLYSLRFSPCGKYLVAGGNTGKLLRWDAAAADDAFTELAPLAGYGGWVQALAFAPQGTRLFVGDSWGRLSAWDYSKWTADDKDAKPTWNLEQAHDGWLRSVVVSPDAKTIATCGRDKFIRLWDAATGKELAEVRNTHDTFVLAYSPDGATLVSGDHAGVVKIWDVKNPTSLAAKPVKELDAKMLAVLNRLQDVGGVRVLAFTPDGKQLLVGGTQPKNGGNVQGSPTVLTFDVATGKQAGAAQEFAGYVYPTDIRFLNDGTLAITLSGNPGAGKLLLTKPGEAKPFFETTKLSNCHAIAPHPTAARFAIAGSGAGIGGNGRGKDAKPEDYKATWTPISVMEIPSKDQMT